MAAGPRDTQSKKEVAVKTLVVYYSLSSTSRMVAEAIAEQLGARTEEIRCTRYTSTFWGVVKAVIDSVRRRRPAIATMSSDPVDFDLVIVGGPVWAGHPSTPVGAYLEAMRGRLPRVAFFLTLGGASGQKSLDEMALIAGKQPEATVLVRAEDVKAGRTMTVLSEFLGTLRRLNGSRRPAQTEWAAPHPPS